MGIPAFAAGAPIPTLVEAIGILVVSVILLVIQIAGTIYIYRGVRSWWEKRR